MLPAAAALPGEGSLVDLRPCASCGMEDRQDQMILCDRCEGCFHRDCVKFDTGEEPHEGPFFCPRCKGDILHQGFSDVMEDWPLHRYLWTGHLPENPDESERIVGLSEKFRANGNELEIRYPPTHVFPERWVSVAPIRNRSEIMMDTHMSLGHCGRDKLYSAVREHWWWPGMSQDAADCCRRCVTC